jgi:hypothetical protein
VPWQPFAHEKILLVWTLRKSNSIKSSIKNYEKSFKGDKNIFHEINDELAHAKLITRPV